MTLRIHYKTWSPARPSWVETVTEEDGVKFWFRDNGFVEIRTAEKRTYIPHHQILAMYSVDE